MGLYFENSPSHCWIAFLFGGGGGRFPRFVLVFLFFIGLVARTPKGFVQDGKE